MEEKKEHEFKVPYPPRSPAKRPAARPVHLGLTSSTLTSGQQQTFLKRKRESDEPQNFSLFTPDKPAPKMTQVGTITPTPTVGQQQDTASGTGQVKRRIVVIPQSVLKLSSMAPLPIGLRRAAPNNDDQPNTPEKEGREMSEHSYTGKESCTGSSPSSSAKGGSQVPVLTTVKGNGLKVPIRYESIIKEHGLYPLPTVHKTEVPQVAIRAAITGKKLQSPQSSHLYQSVGKQQTVISGSLRQPTTEKAEASQMGEDKVGKNQLEASKMCQSTVVKHTSGSTNKKELT